MHQLKEHDYVKVTSVEQRHRIINLAKKAGIEIALASDIGGDFGNDCDTRLCFKYNQIVGWPGVAKIPGAKEFQEIDFIAKMFGIWPTPQPEIYIGEYRVKFQNHGGIVVGCTNVSFEKLEQIYQQAKKNECR